MIIYPNALILSAVDDGAPLANPRIGWQNLARSSSIGASQITVSGETEEGPSDAPLSPDTVEFWLAPSLPATWMVDLGSQLPIDYVGILGTLGTEQNSVLVETSPDGVEGSPSSWTTFSQDYMPADDAPLMLLDDVRTARFVKLTLDGDGDPARVAVIYIGQTLAMPHCIYGGHTPITLSRETVLHNALSRGGQFLGQGFRRHGVKTAVQFKHLEAAWYRDNFDPFVRSARQYPFFFAWRPDDYPAEVGYVWTSADIAPQNMGMRDWMQVGLEMSGIGHE